MNKRGIIKQTAEYVKAELSSDSSGHDWWHAWRVWKNAQNIAKVEKANMFVVELAALLHDIADWKFHNGKVDIGPKVAREWLEKMAVAENDISHICEIIGSLSYKGASVASPMKTKEGMIVQDADRLDAIGAVGIARTFAYGGSKGREMYNPGIKPELHKSFARYKKNKSPSINHFYEKMLFLKDLMNTKTAKKIAKQRHKYIEGFLNEFLAEWEGEK